jgi:hypothetical protein
MADWATEVLSEYNLTDSGDWLVMFTAGDETYKEVYYETPLENVFEDILYHGNKLEMHATSLMAI